MTIKKVATDELAMMALWDSLQIKNEDERRHFQVPRMTDLLMLDFLPGLISAKKRIVNAIKEKERIMIFGDFDADGVTATSLLVHGLTALGGLVSYRIPSRDTDSHGLKKHLLQEIAKTGTKLVITVDCGTNDAEEVKFANDLGLDVIITDHHDADPARKPDCVALVNPQIMKKPSEMKNLAGVGVAFGVLRGVCGAFLGEKEREVFLERYLELVAIGTIADCMSLTGINRTLCQLGMAKMNQSDWPGIRELLNGKAVTSSTNISFGIAPTINAASRIGDVKHAVSLFLGKKEKIPAIVEHLEYLNTSRKSLTKKFLQKAQKQIIKTKKAHMVYLPDCPVGICGLVAGKICETTTQPTVVATNSHGSLSASCRAPVGGHLADCLKASPDLFTSFGGHSQAAGFLAKGLMFDRICHHFWNHYQNFEAEKEERNVIAELESISIAHLDFVSALSTLEPFGVGNPVPIWSIKKAKLLEKAYLGKGKIHMRLMMRMHDESFAVLAFFRADLMPTLQINSEYDLQVSLGQSEWQGESRVEVFLEEIEKADE